MKLTPLRRRLGLSLSSSQRVLLLLFYSNFIVNSMSCPIFLLSIGQRLPMPRPSLGTTQVRAWRILPGRYDCGECSHAHTYLCRPASYSTVGIHCCRFYRLGYTIECCTVLFDAICVLLHLLCCVSIDVSVAFILIAFEDQPCSPMTRPRG